MADGGRVQGFFSSAAPDTSINPNPSFDSDGENGEKEKKKKVVVIMGATGAGKSKLSIDLASHFSALEILNADSMQVYSGLDVLTNKLPLPDRAGIPHHLLGTVDASVEFTSKHFRDAAIPIIDDILSRDCLPVIVGGTNYYIQSRTLLLLVKETLGLLDQMKDMTYSKKLIQSLQIVFIQMTIEKYNGT